MSWPGLTGAERKWGAGHCFTYLETGVCPYTETRCTWGSTQSHPRMDLETGPNGQGTVAVLRTWVPQWDRLLREIGFDEVPIPDEKVCSVWPHKGTPLSHIPVPYFEGFSWKLGSTPVVQRMLQEFNSRQPWEVQWQHPHATPREIRERLTQNGMRWQHFGYVAPTVGKPRARQNQRPEELLATDGHELAAPQAMPPAPKRGGGYRNRGGDGGKGGHRTPSHTTSERDWGREHEWERPRGSWERPGRDSASDRGLAVEVGAEEGPAPIVQSSHMSATEDMDVNGHSMLTAVDRCARTRPPPPDCLTVQQDADAEDVELLPRTSRVRGGSEPAPGDSRRSVNGLHVEPARDVSKHANADGLSPYSNGSRDAPRPQTVHAGRSVPGPPQQQKPGPPDDSVAVTAQAEASGLRGPAAVASTDILVDGRGRPSAMEMGLAKPAATTAAARGKRPRVGDPMGRVQLCITGASPRPLEDVLEVPADGDTTVITNVKCVHGMTLRQPVSVTVHAQLVPAGLEAAGAGSNGAQTEDLVRVRVAVQGAASGEREDRLEVPFEGEKTLVVSVKEVDGVALQEAISIFVHVEHYARGEGQLPTQKVVSAGRR